MDGEHHVHGNGPVQIGDGNYINYNFNGWGPLDLARALVNKCPSLSSMKYAAVMGLSVVIAMIVVVTAPSESDEFGHFNKPFLNGLDKKYLEGLKDRLDVELTDEPYARRHAIINLLGFVHCQLGNITEGAQLFSRVNEEDPTNMNALSNLIWADEQRGLKTNVDESKNKMAAILEKVSAEELMIIKARALIEIARAACSTDQHHLQEGNIDFAKLMFEEGLNIGKDNPSRDEYMDWKFGYAFHLRRIAKKLRNDRPDDVTYLKAAIRQFYDVAVYSRGAVTCHQPRGQDLNNMNQAATWKLKRIEDMGGKAWAFTGRLLLWFKNKYATLSAVLPECSPQHANFSGFLCLEEAKSLAPRCGVVLRYIAQVYGESNRFKKALAVANDAIDVQPIGFAFYVRGQIFLKLYETSRTNPTGDQSDIQYLNSALRDLSEAYKKHFRPSYAVRDLAVAYCMTSDTALHALDYFKRAEIAMGGKKDHRMYDEWAKCLDSIKDSVGAEEKRKCAEAIRKNELCK